MENNNYQRCYFAWGFCDVGCSCSLTLLSFLFFILLFFLIHCFSTSSLTLPWTIAGFLHSFYTFSPARHWMIRDTFILTFPRSSFTVLPRALRFWEGIFYPHAFFTLRFFTDILPAFIKTSLGAGSFSLKFAGLHTDPQNRDPAHLFIWFTVIHNVRIRKNSFLNSAVYYDELLVVKSLVYMLLTCFELFSLVQSAM